MFQFRNFRHTGLLLPKGNYIYTFIHVIDSIPCRTSHIEYKYQGKIHHFFEKHHLIPMVFMAKYFFHSSATPVVGGTLRWASKIHFFLSIKKHWSFRGTSETLFFDTNRENPWKTMKTRGRFIHFWGTSPISIGFHCNCKVVFIIVLRHRSWGAPLGELKKIIFLNTIIKKLIISGTVFFLKCSSLGTSDIQGCYSPKGITYIPLYM